MRIIADRDRCIGAGQCVLTDSSLFDQSETDGRVLLLFDRADVDHASRVREAVALCPSSALRFDENP